MSLDAALQSLQSVQFDLIEKRDTVAICREIKRLRWLLFCKECELSLAMRPLSISAFPSDRAIEAAFLREGGMKYKEIAKSIGVRPSYVWSLIEKGESQLRRLRRCPLKEV